MKYEDLLFSIFFFIFHFYIKKKITFENLLVSKMLCFSYFVNAYSWEENKYLAFWKCVEKIMVFPNTLLNIQQFSKLHVVYLNIRQ